jgi:AraC-like DNA-binding protein
MLLSREAFRRLCRARDSIDDLPEEARSVRDVAAAAEISPYHFIRQFEALFGTTPHQLRIQRRVDRAKDLLARGELSVTDICMEVGFSSLGTFSVMFSRRVGATPSDYRRRARAMIQVPGTWVSSPPPGCLGLLLFCPEALVSAPPGEGPFSRRNFGEAEIAHRV